MRRILFVIGSLRAKSFNRQLAVEAARMLEGKAEVAWLDYADLPLVNQDAEFPASGPLARVREEVRRADGVWIFTPEYNGSYPGHLKNLLDWLSRPLEAGNYSVPTVVAGKKVCLSGAGGRAATAGCRARLGELLRALQANLMEAPQTGVALTPDCWATDVLSLTDGQRADLQAQAGAFLKFLGHE